MDVQRVVDLLDGRWAVVGPMAGGYQQGATRLTSPDGDAVLKVVETAWDTEQWANTKVAVERARANGWPTPAWLAHGFVDDSLTEAYVVTEFVDGATPTALTPSLLDQFLTILDRQRGLEPATRQDYSTYLRTVVVAGSAQATSVSSFSPDGARFVARLLAIVGEPAVLTQRDFVHGDFAPDNALVREGRVVAMIDCLLCGKGDALVDASSLAYWVHSWDEDGNAPAELVVDAVVDFGDGDGHRLASSISCRMLEVLTFGTRHWPDYVDPLISKFEPLVRRLDSFARW